MHYTITLLFIIISLLSGCSDEPSTQDVYVNNGVLYERSSQEPFTGRITEHYDSGNKQSQCDFVDGLHDGLCLEWYDNGQIQSWKEGKAGRLLGYSKYWHEDGSLASCAFVDEANSIHKDCDQHASDL